MAACVSICAFLLHPLVSLTERVSVPVRFRRNMRSPSHTIPVQLSTMCRIEITVFTQFSFRQTYEVLDWYNVAYRNCIAVSTLLYMDCAEV